MYVPPQKYGMVEPGIHRCIDLQPINLEFISTLGLNSVVWIDREKPTRQIESYLKSNSITLFLIHTTNDLAQEEEDDDSISIVKYKSLRGLELILDLRNAPVLVVDSSGMTIGLLRKLMNWSFSSTVGEFRRMVENANYRIEAYLELADVKIIKHSDIPQNSQQQRDTASEGQDHEPEKRVGLPVEQSPSHSPQIPKALLMRVQKRKQAHVTGGDHVTLPHEDFLFAYQ